MMDTDLNKADKTPLLEFDNATVLMGGKFALDAVSFKIGVGENVAIIGPNGSGKSTLIRTITRECYPKATDNGPALRILGEHTWDLFRLRSMLGIVSGNLQQICDRDISGYDTVLSGFFGSIGLYPYYTITKQMEKRAREIIEFLEVPHLAEKPMNQMSTGEARRILIGRALVHKPKALMLDEPANGLDPRAAHRFSNTLRKIARTGKSIIMVTHHLQDIIPEISRVIMIKNGQIFRDGTKDEVLTQEILSELFSMPIEIVKRNGYYHLWA